MGAVELGHSVVRHFSVLVQIASLGEFLRAVLAEKRFLAGVRAQVVKILAH